jgi:hypothetical protein
MNTLWQGRCDFATNSGAPLIEVDNMRILQLGDSSEQVIPTQIVARSCWVEIRWLRNHIDADIGERGATRVCCCNLVPTLIAILRGNTRDCTSGSVEGEPRAIKSWGHEAVIESWRDTVSDISTALERLGCHIWNLIDWLAKRVSLSAARVGVAVLSITAVVEAWLVRNNFNVARASD